MNTRVYIDFENIHKIFRKNYKNVLDQQFFEKLGELFKDKDFNILSINLYSNFDEADLHECYFQSKIQQLNINTMHTQNSHKNYADLVIESDIHKILYKEQNTDLFIIISSDKDMIPIIKDIKEENKKVYLITTKNDFDYGVRIFPNEHYFIEDILNNYKVDDFFNHKEKIINNINYALKRAKKDNNPHPNYDYTYILDHVIKNLRIFKYEAYKLFMELEKDNKIKIYRYFWGGFGGNQKECFGIITEDQFEEYSKVILKADFLESFFNEKEMKAIYDTYNPREGN